ncbi:MAG: acetate--CoA ligase family protein [Desulfobacterales bacterium]|nr:acetate--CoA ligase family protein [Desulfobacterales bacterium]MDD4392220.1 acetate--CoA ligase family protein [Desulfobacterales bacterium]
MNSNGLNPFFHPKSVVVIGASDQPGKLGHVILNNIVNGGYPGTVYPVNPKQEKILGLTCYSAVGQVPDQVDLAVVIVPARFVPQVITECGKKRVKAAIIVSGGFREIGKEGEALQQAVFENAQAWGIRVLGPNCQGVNNPYHPLCASWPLLTGRGRVAVISQSGTVGAAMMDWFTEEHLGVSGFVSMGNRVDVDEADLIRYFQTDSNTKVIALYMEGVKNPERFQKAVDGLTKPLVVLKSGRTPKGKLAAQSHTRSLAGADAVYSALFQRCGICRADTMEEFFDMAKALAYLKKPVGRRIMFVTTSGGAGILAVDAAEQMGFDIPPLPEELIRQLDEIIPPQAIRNNPLDLTGDANARMFEAVIQKARPFYDTLGIIFGDPVADASSAVTPEAHELVVFMGGADVERKEKIKMHEQGIPVFPTPERAVNAMAQLLPPTSDSKPVFSNLPETTARIHLGFFESISFLKDKGICCVSARLAQTADEAVCHADELGYPVVLKIESPDVMHKSDVGGVRLNLNTADEVKVAFIEMTGSFCQEHPKWEIRGGGVSAMAPPSGLEVIMGFIRDPQFGPVMLFGLGGVLVELVQDVSTRLLPLTRQEALDMMGEIRGAVLLKGYRGRPPVDVNALADLLVRLAEIARVHEDIVEMDLNPVLAYPSGALVVDARILKR